jgi:hypothetical protein
MLKQNFFFFFFFFFDQNVVFGITKLYAHHALNFRRFHISQGNPTPNMTSTSINALSVNLAAEASQCGSPFLPNAALE